MKKRPGRGALRPTPTPVTWRILQRGSPSRQPQPSSVPFATPSSPAGATSCRCSPPTAASRWTSEAASRCCGRRRGYEPANGMAFPSVPGLQEHPSSRRLPRCRSLPSWLEGARLRHPLPLSCLRTRRLGEPFHDGASMSWHVMQAVIASELKAPTKTVALMMAYHARDDCSESRAGVDTLASETGLNRTTVLRAIARLEKDGVIAHVGGGGPRPKEYDFRLEGLGRVAEWTYEQSLSATTSGTSSSRSPHASSRSPHNSSRGERHNRKKEKKDPEKTDRDFVPEIEPVYRPVRGGSDPEIVLTETGTPAPETDPVLHYPEVALFGAPRVPPQTTDLVTDLPHSDRTAEPDPEDREGLVVGVGWIEVPEHHDSPDLTDTVRNADCDECARWAGKASFCPKCKVPLALNPVRSRRTG
jgi:hypothetical protein